jgi:hypothetical protein
MKETFLLSFFLPKVNQKKKKKKRVLLIMVVPLSLFPFSFNNNYTHIPFLFARLPALTGFEFFRYLFVLTRIEATLVFSLKEKVVNYVSKNLFS